MTCVFHLTLVTFSVCLFFLTKVTDCIIIGLFFLVAYGIYIFFPPHVRHLAYLAGIIDKPLVTAHEL